MFSSNETDQYQFCIRVPSQWRIYASGKSEALSSPKAIKSKSVIVYPTLPMIRLTRIMCFINW
jgi:hypothetical protein